MGRLKVCGKCIAYVSFPKDTMTPSGKRGECHLCGPSVSNVNLSAVWPQVNPDDFCLKFKRRSKDG